MAGRTAPCQKQYACFQNGWNPPGGHTLGCPIFLHVTHKQRKATAFFGKPVHRFATDCNSRKRERLLYYAQALYYSFKSTIPLDVDGSEKVSFRDRQLLLCQTRLCMEHATSRWSVVGGTRRAHRIAGVNFPERIPFAGLHTEPTNGFAKPDRSRSRGYRDRWKAPCLNVDCVLEKENRIEYHEG